ncbi:MAG: hypothetical protein ACREEM_30745 [Blastocatellia bacterium]
MLAEERISLTEAEYHAGVEAAKRAGMRCLAVTNSYAAEALQEADWIVASLAGYELDALFT